MVAGGATATTIVGACTGSECTQHASETRTHQYWLAAGQLQAHAIYCTHTTFAVYGIANHLHRKLR